MAGSYCNYCGHRCFVLRVLPDGTWPGHLATCAGGMAHDRRALGHDHTTAINPVLDTIHGDVTFPAGLELHQTGPGGGWLVIHAQSGLPLPMVGWPTDAIPRCYASLAMTTLGASNVDWTRPREQLLADLETLGRAVRTAATAARELALADGHPAAHTHPGAGTQAQRNVDLADEQRAYISEAERILAKCEGLGQPTSLHSAQASRIYAYLIAPALHDRRLAQWLLAEAAWRREPADERGLAAADG